MDYVIHPDALEELKQLPANVRKAIKDNINSRIRREKNLLQQRGVGISYDSHSEPVHYFKVQQNQINYRVFFQIENTSIQILGARPRDSDTYLNLREYTRRQSR